MLLVLKTMSGTVYTLDTKKRTWKRERNPENCGEGWQSSEFEHGDEVYEHFRIESDDRLSICRMVNGKRKLLMSTPIISIETHIPNPMQVVGAVTGRTSMNAPNVVEVDKREVAGIGFATFAERLGAEVE